MDKNVCLFVRKSVGPSASGRPRAGQQPGDAHAVPARQRCHGGFRSPARRRAAGPESLARRTRPEPLAWRGRAGRIDHSRAFAGKRGTMVYHATPLECGPARGMAGPGALIPSSTIILYMEGRAATADGRSAAPGGYRAARIDDGPAGRCGKIDEGGRRAFDSCRCLSSGADRRWERRTRAGDRLRGLASFRSPPVIAGRRGSKIGRPAGAAITFALPNICSTVRTIGR